MAPADASGAPVSASPRTTRSACIASASAVKSGRSPPMPPRWLLIGGSQPRSGVYEKPSASSATTAAMRCLSIEMVHLPMLLRGPMSPSKGESKAAGRLSTAPMRVSVVVISRLARPNLLEAPGMPFGRASIPLTTPPRSATRSQRMLVFSARTASRVTRSRSDHPTTTHHRVISCRATISPEPRRAHKGSLWCSSHVELPRAHQPLLRCLV